VLVSVGVITAFGVAVFGIARLHDRGQRMGPLGWPPRLLALARDRK
jgi:hypothetical protein